ncbi:hypothetical protein B0H11DRAFT_2049986 [Mycena galericulata]|nr:hypothetical protein B0H11DRAFT_2049986 [Mycena galericulata]
MHQPPNWNSGVIQPPMHYSPFLPTPSNSSGPHPTANHFHLHPTRSVAIPFLPEVIGPGFRSVTQDCAPPQIFMAPRVQTTTRSFPIQFPPEMIRPGTRPVTQPCAPPQMFMEPHIHTKTRTQPTAQRSYIYPIPAIPAALPSTRPRNCRNRCADRYREHQERIKNVVRMATENAAELHAPIECKRWPGCHVMVSTVPGALWMHLKSMHGVLEGGRVSCLWAGCSETMRSSSLVQHVKSVHLHWRVICPSCGESFAREDTLKRHLSGER